jgi:hypothetical protein
MDPFGGLSGMPCCRGGGRVVVSRCGHVSGMAGMQGLSGCRAVGLVTLYGWVVARLVG